MQFCYIAIDQGTTSTRAMAFSDVFDVIHIEQVALEQHYPANGYVEHNAHEIWTATLRCLDNLQKYIENKGYKAVSIGITNQRETCLLWDKTTGTPAGRAIVWQDRRTATLCKDLHSEEGLLEATRTETGLLLDPYFSATMK